MLNTDYLQADTPRLQFGNTRNSAVARQHDVSRLHFFQDTQGDVLLSLVLSEHQRLVGVDTCGDGIFVCSGFFLFPTHCRNKTQVPPLSGRSGKCWIRYFLPQMRYYLSPDGRNRSGCIMGHRSVFRLWYFRLRRRLPSGKVPGCHLIGFLHKFELFLALLLRRSRI